MIEIRDAIDEKIDEQHKRMGEINTELINRGVLEYPEDFTYETQESAEDIVRALEKEFSEGIPKTLAKTVLREAGYERGIMEDLVHHGEIHDCCTGYIRTV
ncbi:hypothetical protein [Haloplanus salinarum]|uniref:hypothetical protein n=2 Tax=Haloplanus salinarum TaxID=1912324 RepID=UPI00214BCBC7|nr:hypothetical protein [Haloplanus salinarum]